LEVFTNIEIVLIFQAFPANMTVAPYAGWGGRLDEVRIWNTFRTQAQIGQYYTTDLTGNETNLFAYYNFDDISTFPTIADVSPNGRYLHHLFKHLTV
jgi:hypothetical protein